MINHLEQHLMSIRFVSINFALNKKFIKFLKHNSTKLLIAIKWHLNLKCVFQIKRFCTVVMKQVCPFLNKNKHFSTLVNAGLKTRLVISKLYL